jgi:hypothetical protein
MIIESGSYVGRDAYRTPGQLENRSIEPKSAVKEDDKDDEKVAKPRVRNAGEGEDGRTGGAGDRPGSRVDIYA